jgi:hypothetical protein
MTYVESMISISHLAVSFNSSFPFLLEKLSAVPVKTSHKERFILGTWSFEDRSSAVQTADKHFYARMM